MDIEAIRRLNQATGSGLTAAKAALTAAGGDFAAALEALGASRSLALAKRDRKPAGAGLIVSYVHGGRIGVLVEINCETDWAAKSPVFADFGKNLALQIAASDDGYPDAAPEALTALSQSEFIKDSQQTVADYRAQVAGQLGEKIVIRRFVRFDLSPGPEAN